MEVVNSDEPSEVILRSSNLMKSCVCSRTWVLVVHNDFLQVKGYERVGNDVDLQNLSRVFQSERQCEFAELANCNKAQILETLTSQQKLNQLFHPGRDSKFLIDFAIFQLIKIVRSRASTRGSGAVLPVLSVGLQLLHFFFLLIILLNMSFAEEESIDPPENFYLFILSHGKSGGKILTDHFETNASVSSLESYNTKDVWTSLAELEYFRSCNKLLFFAVSYNI